MRIFIRHLYQDVTETRTSKAHLQVLHRKRLCTANALNASHLFAKAYRYYHTHCNIQAEGKSLSCFHVQRNNLPTTLLYFYKYTCRY